MSLQIEVETAFNRAEAEVRTPGGNLQEAFAHYKSGARYLKCLEREGSASNFAIELLRTRQKELEALLE